MSTSRTKHYFAQPDFFSDDTPGSVMAQVRRRLEARKSGGAIEPTSETAPQAAEVRPTCSERSSSPRAEAGRRKARGSKSEDPPKEPLPPNRPSGDRFLSVREVCERFSIAPATVWRWSADADLGFPKPIRLSAGVTRWRESELRAFELRREVAR
jgi:predicted DNA-binding transcriptional regulator AlpA